MIVIRNGVNNNIRFIESKLEGLKLPDKFICCAGGIGPRKNQLNLVVAANRSKIPLVIIGNPTKGNKSYYKKIKKIAGQTVYFVDHLQQNDMWAVISKSKGHIQPSFIETPGLVSLEAAMIGCSIGVSDVPPVKEYFGDYVYYCDPNSIYSIEQCLQKIFNADTNTEKDRLKQYVLKNYTWENVLSELPMLINKCIMRNTGMHI